MQPTRTEHPALEELRRLRELVGVLEASVAEERESADDRLRRAIQRFRLAATASRALVYEWDPETGFVDRSWGVFEMTGYLPEETEPTSIWWQSRVHPDDRERTLAATGGALEPGGLLVAEYRFRHKDRHYIHVRDTCVRLADREGRPGRMVGTTVDVSERVVAEERLRRSEAQVRMLMDSVPAAIGYVGSDGRYVRVNAGFCSWFRRRPEEIEGRPQREVLTPDYYRRVEPYVQRVLAGESPSFETELTGPSGVHHIRVSYTPDIAADGQVSGFVVFAYDVTDQRKAEQALRESERQRALALAAGRMGTWRWHADRNLAEWSETAEALFGLPPGGYDGTEERFFRAVHPEDRELVRRLVDEAIRTGQDYSCEYRVVWPDGTVRWIAAQGRLVQDARGALEGLTGVSWDCTARREAEEALRRSEERLQESEERLRVATEAAGVGIWCHYPRENRLLWSPQCKRLFGQEPDDRELTLEQFLACIHPADRDRIEAACREPVRTEGPQDLQYRILLPDGTERWVATCGLAFAGADGKVIRVLGVAQDITSRKRVEEERDRQARALARSNEDLQQFAYATSHDLQEPLRMVSGYVQLLAKRYKGRLDEDADEFIAYAVTAVQRMSTLIQDLLAYSRVASSESRQPQPVAMDAVLQWTLMNLHMAVRDAGGQVTFDPLPTVLGDQSQLVQLVQNLIGNALKYRGHAPPSVHISAERSGRAWTFAVRDNGVGVPPEYHERVFGLFKRLHGREVPGTGLGLAICRKIVEQHGGRIWVESEGDGKGSTFRFTLPAP